MNPTKAKLMLAVTDLLKEDGIAGLSARAIATRADVNQALVFYHFGTVTDLVDQACRAATDDAAASYRDEFAEVTSLRELLELGRVLHERERAAGNITVMAQLLAGAQRDETLAETARYALGRWNGEIEAAVARALKGSPVEDVVDAPGLSRAISAAFVGLLMYDGVDRPGADSAFTSLEQLGALVEVIEDLGPAARLVLRSRLKGRS
ncbi:TetR/AcrR family transcriptional regulator [Nocardioides albus]|uniref:AcrR family transcriptional regulator n=1 Tax=Nocardioides albus TaxID=1841 RepID=A0A7W5A3N5_9ACTN|nr:TetR family transcriptional regulator [Nocardioides albus]MBB3088926.1 AcrR family transcriptional regulator [Nocardioides albus]GGU46997.1 TetR family transcriptional regulator [Nocardioides albus]